MTNFYLKNRNIISADFLNKYSVENSTFTFYDCNEYTSRIIIDYFNKLDHGICIFVRSKIGDISIRSKKLLVFKECEMKFIRIALLDQMIDTLIDITSCKIEKFIVIGRSMNHNITINIKDNYIDDDRGFLIPTNLLLTNEIVVNTTDDTYNRMDNISYSNDNSQKRVDLFYVAKPDRINEIKSKVKDVSLIPQYFDTEIFENVVNDNKFDTTIFRCEGIITSNELICDTKRIMNLDDLNLYKHIICSYSKI